ncbi:MAG: cyclic nucleotide-binding domain-containing protein [Desulfobacula sp.]|nr:cyclic nucleotide-binding domain-containing protein [Desulfobacula sp.]
MQIDELVDQGQKEKAVKVIFNTIVDYAREKQFDKAEKLRERLIEVNSMALNEIINSGEIIETERSKAIDLKHKKIWATLYDEFTTEEANALYFALKKIKINPDKTIIKQGKLSNKLFFIEQGTLKVVYFKNGREMFLKNIIPGEVSGNDTFFPISVATTSAITLEQSTLHYLEREDFDNIVKKYAGFDKKLEQFCKKNVRGEIKDIIKNQGIERRNYNRYKASGKVAVYKLDPNKQPNKIPLYGLLEEFSEGGLSLMIKSSNKAEARLHLGKIVLLKIIFEETGLKLAKNGIVLSVDNQLFKNYSMSLKLLKPIPLLKLQEVIGSN